LESVEGALPCYRTCPGPDTTCVISYGKDEGDGGKNDGLVHWDVNNDGGDHKDNSDSNGSHGFCNDGGNCNDGKKLMGM
jgi:hypothetical protein